MMTKRTILLAVCFIGCGDRASLGDHSSGKESLSVSEPNESTTTDAGSAPANGADAGSVAASDIAFIEVDEILSGAPRTIRVDADCRVTDGDGLDAMGDVARCQELFTVSVDPTPLGCGMSCIPNLCIGTVRMHLNDGRDLVRDLGADRCSTTIPSVPTHKFTYAVWYSAGGGK